MAAQPSPNSSRLLRISSISRAGISVPARELGARRRSPSARSAQRAGYLSVSPLSRSASPRSPNTTGERSRHDARHSIDAARPPERCTPAGRYDDAPLRHRPGHAPPRPGVADACAALAGIGLGAMPSSARSSAAKRVARSPHPEASSLQVAASPDSRAPTSCCSWSC